MNCDLCNEPTDDIYRMNGYEIIQCQSCFTSRVKAFPKQEDLDSFYDGFLFTANAENAEKFLSPQMEEWLHSLMLPEDSKMLDIGGGGGFMCNAFEHFNIGEAFYIDLDARACEFAKNELGLKNVFNVGAAELKSNVSGKFNFIFCRHVIEHLIDPLNLINDAVDLLADDGVLVLYCPNGLSFEYLGHPKMMRPRLEKLRTSNHWSIMKSMRVLMSKRIAHGLDPERHLWAFTKKGLSSWLSNRRDIGFHGFTTSLTNKIYSPYYQAEGFFIRIWLRIVERTLVKISGGTHLVFHVRKKV